MNKILGLLGAILILVTGAAAVGLLDSLVSSTPAVKASASTVQIAGFTFKPAKVHVSVGGKLTWMNLDSAAHTATADQGPTFDTGTLQQHQSMTVTFPTAGTFTYHCVFHAFMRATVTVG